MQHIKRVGRGSGRVGATLSAICGAIAAAGPAFGQTSEPAVPAPILLDPITIEATTPVPPTATIGNLPPAFAGGQVARGQRLGVLGNRDYMETPFSTQSYTSDFIQNQQLDSVTDLIELDPSVSKTESAGSYNGFSYARFRGFEQAPSDNTASIDGLVGATYLSPAVEFLERVDIIKGPNAFLNGVLGAVGGSLNYVLKRAPDQPLYAVTGTYASDTVFGGNVDLGQRFGADNAFGVRAIAFGRYGNTAMKEGQQRDDGAALSLDYRGDRLRLEAAYLHDNRRSYGYSYYVTLAQGVQLPKAPRADLFTQPTWMNYESRQDLGLARAEYDLAPNWTISTAYGLGEGESKYNGYCVAILLDPGGATRCDAAAGGGKEKWQTGDLTLRGDVRTWALRHQLVFGANAIDVESSNLPFVPYGAFNYNLFQSSRPGQPSISTSGKTSKRSDQLTTGAFAADTVSILDDRVSFTGAVRRTRAESDNFSLQTGDKTSSYDESELTPLVGLLVKLTPEISLYGSYIEALEQGGTAPATAVNAGEVFPPLVSKQWEAGVKADFGQVGATLAVFRIKKANQFLDFSTNIYSQDGEQVNRGVEVSVFGAPLPGVRLLAGAAYIDAELENTSGGEFDGNTAPAVPDWEGRLIGEWDLPWVPGLTATGSVVHSGKAEYDNANSQTVPAWTELGLGARYAFDAYGRPLVARLNVENVTGADHWQAGYGSAALSVGGPRRVLVSLTANF